MEDVFLQTNKIHKTNLRNIRSFISSVRLRFKVRVSLGLVSYIRVSYGYGYIRVSIKPEFVTIIYVAYDKLLMLSNH